MECQKEMIHEQQAKLCRPGDVVQTEPGMEGRDEMNSFPLDIRRSDCWFGVRRYRIELVQPMLRINACAASQDDLRGLFSYHLFGDLVALLIGGI